jgi:hypothetical protein
MKEATMPFGRHRGQPISKVPELDLRWYIRNLTRLSSRNRSLIEMELQRRLDVVNGRLDPRARIVPAPRGFPADL